MEKRVIFGEITKKEMLLLSETSGILLSETDSELIVEGAVMINDIPTVDAKTGEEEEYNLLVLKTNVGNVRVPNDVATNSIIKFTEICKDNDVELKTITIKKKERKSASTGQNYLDVEILDFE